jgi:hypothetical protein
MMAVEVIRQLVARPTPVLAADHSIGGKGIDSQPDSKFREGESGSSASADWEREAVPGVSALVGAGAGAAGLGTAAATGALAGLPGGPVGAVIGGAVGLIAGAVAGGAAGAATASLCGESDSSSAPLAGDDGASAHPLEPFSKQEQRESTKALAGRSGPRRETNTGRKDLDVHAGREL